MLWEHAAFTSSHSRALVIASITTAALVACTADSSVPSSSTTSPSESSAANADSGLWDSSDVHSISIDYAAADFDEMVDAYLSSGAKDWISATVVIDGQTFENVGLKLKGNSSLRALSTDEDAELSAANPQDLPWIIRLDKFVDGQSLDGTTELVVRGNSSETALNEALALELLDQTGLAAEQAVAVRLSVAGSEETLRLVIENPDDRWSERELGSGPLYKAEAGGDYSYRGDDASAYDDVFDQEAADDDLDPLIDFLQWINDADDATFAAQLDQHLDVDAFATYLAFQEIVDNFDDIDGPGNNSYLYFDPDSGRMTVVSWDLNLAFGANPGGAGPGEGGMGGVPPAEDGNGNGNGNGGAWEGASGPGGGRGGGSNVLSERFLADDQFRALYESELTRLQAELIDSGLADGLLEDWTDTLIEQASDLVPAETISQESAALATSLTQ